MDYLTIKNFLLLRMGALEHTLKSALNLAVLMFLVAQRPESALRVVDTRPHVGIQSSRCVFPFCLVENSNRSKHTHALLTVCELTQVRNE